MNIPRLPPLRAAGLTLLFLVSSTMPAAVAQDATSAATRAATDSELVVSNGTFLRRGERVPATVRNIVDAITQRYPRTNITIVGVENVLIDTVTLRWGTARVAPGQGEVYPPLHGMLFALKAASGNRFAVESFGPTDFVLSPSNGRSGSRFAEVFNLGPLLGGNRTQQFERALLDAEAELAAARKVFGADHPKVAERRTHVEMIKAHLAQGGPVNDPTKTIERIQSAVKLTLQLLKSGEQPPEFSYHPGTNLLILVGGDEALEVTRKVVTALERAAN
jgi:hypothetical protein